MSEINLFKADDFMLDHANAVETSKKANKILDERLVKWSAIENGDDCYLITKEKCDGDTHIIYGLEPQPIVREEKKVEITRGDLAAAFEKVTAYGTSGNIFKDVCKELGL